MKDNAENSTSNKEEEYDWGKHPNSLKALKKHQYPPKVSGNPDGRPPKIEKLKRAFIKYANQTYDRFDAPMDYNGETRRELVINKIWTQAERGNEKSQEILMRLGCLDEE